MNADQKIVQKQVESNIRSRVGDEAFAAYGEIIAALAYACTFKNPRRFVDMDMNERTWQDLASSITVLELQNVASSLARFTSGNRLFFILGCLTRAYSRRKSSVSSSNFTQRRYTKAEIASNVVHPDELSGIEW